MATLIKNEMFKTFPSFNEIINNEKYSYRKLEEMVIHPLSQGVDAEYEMDKKWEPVAMVVNEILRSISGKPLYNNYDFYPTDEDCDWTTGKNIGGMATLTDTHDNTFEVDYITFINIVLIAYLKGVRGGINNTNSDEYFNFLKNNEFVNQILN